MKAAGFNASELKAAGFSRFDLIATGFTLVQMRAAAFNANDLFRMELPGGRFVSCADLREAGFTTTERELLEAVDRKREQERREEEWRKQREEYRSRVEQEIFVNPE